MFALGLKIQINFDHPISAHDHQEFVDRFHEMLERELTDGSLGDCENPPTDFELASALEL